MNYEMTPAAQLLATHCAACARPLVDAVSVEIGLGPTCRKKYGYDARASELEGDARTEANRLVYAIAARQSGLEVAEAVVRLRALGFEKLADCITTRCETVRIVERLGSLEISAPYNAEATIAWRSIKGRLFDRELKINVVPATEKRAVWDLLKKHYTGAIAIGPKGAFIVA
jgi:hypothetical protein